MSDRFRLLLALCILLAMTVPAVAQLAPVIDNERVTVWDVILTAGTPGPSTPHELDTVIMFLEGGSIRTVAAGLNYAFGVCAADDALFVSESWKHRIVAIGPDGDRRNVLDNLPVYPSR